MQATRTATATSDIPDEQLDDTLFALSDRTRRGIVRLLAQGECNAGAIGTHFTLAAPTISKHLRVLREATLIEEVRDPHDARVRIYRLRRKPLDDVDAWLAHMRAFWSLQLDAFARHVRQAAAKPTVGTRQKRRQRR